MTHNSIESACRIACEAIGVIYKSVPCDGAFHVADLADDHKGKNDARIKIFQDRQGGICWNHKSGAQQTFFVNNNRESGEPTPPAELERIKREQQRRQVEQQTRQDKAASRARSIWQAAKPAPEDHPYLARKQVKPHGLRVGIWKRTVQDEHGKYHPLLIGNVLLLPMVDQTGVIRSLQAIFAEKHPDLNRDKDFLPGGGLAGLFWWIGAKTEKVLIAEGFATAATLHEESGYRVYMAFTANNLMAVGRIVREKLSNAEIVFCADNDIQTPGNPGLTKATEAAQAVGGSVTVPPIHGDFNDYAICLKGLDNDAE
jgi:putative DNA primase/helicase